MHSDCSQSDYGTVITVIAVGVTMELLDSMHSKYSRSDYGTVCTVITLGVTTEEYPQ